ncbi:MAG: type VI secretion system baseplate subunit TssF [Alphaproteobacteria bacterium]
MTRFIDYYHEELSYLRNSGKIFAKKYPKIARRLDFSDQESPDPHTERLLESFAFLTAQLRQEIDNRFPEIASALLEILYPHLAVPLPSVAIAQFQADQTKGNFTQGYSIAPKTFLYAYGEQDQTCRFQTIYPVKLWPIRIERVSIVGTSDYVINDNNVPATSWFLCIGLKSTAGAFETLNFDDTTFHIRTDGLLGFEIFKGIFANNPLSAFVSIDKKTAIKMPDGSLQSLGFKREEVAVEVNSKTTHAYQLLQEYFHFPEKFLFFKVAKFNEMAPVKSDTLEILIPLTNIDKIWNQNIGPSNILLGCTPIINLFQKTTDPLRLTHTKRYYRLSPDQRRDRTTEIYKILNVWGAVEGEKKNYLIPPYFSLDHHTMEANDSVFWISKRKSARWREVSGSDMYISFVDLNFKPQDPPKHIIYAKTLCTNRFLAEQLPGGAELYIEETPPVSHIVCLDRPVSERYAPETGETLWMLISNLALNHISFIDSNKDAEVLRETLKLHARERYAHFEREINSVENVSASRTVKRIREEAWRGFINGIRVKLAVKHQKDATGNLFLLTTILQHYLSLHVSINSFVEVLLATPHESILCPLLTGEKIVL